MYFLIAPLCANCNHELCQTKWWGGQYLGQNSNYKLQFWDKKKHWERFNITPQDWNILIFRWTEAGLYADCSASLVCRGKENKKCGFVARLCLWPIYLLRHIHPLGTTEECVLTHWTRGVVMLYGWWLGGRGDRREGRQHLLLDCDGLHGHLLGLEHMKPCIHSNRNSLGLKKLAYGNVLYDV